jgi:formylglycine-generating enzyme
MASFDRNCEQFSCISHTSAVLWAGGGTYKGTVGLMKLNSSLRSWRPTALLLGCLLVTCLCALDRPARADIFGSGANSFQIEFVTIGNPGNPPDTTDRPVTDGAVPYRYRIGKYEISEQMIGKANALGGLGITMDSRGPDFPATSVTWYEAARFVNWLNMSEGHSPAYKFDDSGAFQLWLPSDPGYDAANLYRNRRAMYFLPSLDEWHKAAYYDPATGVYYDYPTGSDAVPDGIDSVGDPNFDALFNDGATNPDPNVITDVGLLSPFGTAGQGGNVAEWEETSFDRRNNSSLSGRAYRGGGWGNIATHLLAANRNSIGPGFEANFFGFRVAAIPEPASLSLLTLSLLALLHTRERHSESCFGLSSYKNTYAPLYHR